MLNQVILMGRLTRDPERRYTEQGKAVTSFSLAVERDYKPEGGERGVDFIDCVAFGGSAEFAAKYFTRGQMAAVTGRLQVRDWKDKDGNKRRSTEVITSNIHFCGGKQQEAAGSNEPRMYATPVENAYSDVYDDYDESELPY